MPDDPALVVLASCARALAASARRGGYAPLAVDLFGDEDTREIALACRVLGEGFEPRGVLAAMEELASAHTPIGLVYGAGLEDRPGLIEALARRFRVFGNAAATVARAKNPEALASLCAECGVDHPAVSLEAPEDPAGWLAKRRGGAGGEHVRPAAGFGGGGAIYFQRQTAGESVSALALADGARARIVGLSSQWTAPAADAPYRFGGAVGPIAPPAAVVAAIGHAVDALTARLGLIGLNAFDFLTEGPRAWLIEVNPRPGATLDIFDRENPRGLVHLHIEACLGRLPEAPAPNAARAARVIYAPCDLTVASVPKWPDWANDRSAPGTKMSAGAPFCTVFADAADAGAARDLVEARARKIVAMTAVGDRHERLGT